MASIMERGKDGNQWQVTIRRKGFPKLIETFETHAEAKAWGILIESEMIRGVFVDRREAERMTFGEALRQYAEEYSENKRGREVELVRIKALLQHPLALRSLASLRKCDFATYRKERLKLVAPATVNRELVIMSHVFTVAADEWSLRAAAWTVG
jgi:hypothetical protein